MPSTSKRIKVDSHRLQPPDLKRPMSPVEPRSIFFIAGLVSAAFGFIVLLLALNVAAARAFLDRGPLSHGEVLSTTLESRVPISCISHNDYWRDVPLHSALQAGCIGVEADVWAYRDELYVAHNRMSMAPERTLSHMYLNPLFSILQSNNPSLGMDIPARGVYALEPGQTLVLLVDLKSDVQTVWPILLDKLKPLHENGWLSYSGNEGFVSRPITVVVSGKALVDFVETRNSLRHIFFDAPLAGLEQGTYNTSNSYYASVSFKKSIGRVGLEGPTPAQLLKMRRQIEGAHSRGLKVRYWGLPTWPQSNRNQVWDILMGEGVDILNVDDLAGAREAHLNRQ